MSYKVVRDAKGYVVSSGPNNDQFVPHVGVGESLVIEPAMPLLTLSWVYARQQEYAKLNQDEMRYDDLIDGTTTWQDAIAAIKLKYPKP